MMNLNRLFTAALAAIFIVGSAQAQNAGTVTNHAFAVGKGPGVGGYTSLLCGSAQLAVGQAAADPICQTISGDVTISAAGVTAIGATKVTSAMLNADVFSTAHSWAGQQTFVAPILGTPASGVATNLTGTAAGLTAGHVTTNANLTGDVTSVGNAATLANIPTGIPMAGSLLGTNIAAPATPAAGKTSVYIDSTDKRLHDKNDAGTIGTTVVASTAAANSFATAVSSAGVVAYTQPSFSNISGSVAATQLPNPSATTLGGVRSAAAVANQWINSISTAGIPALSQPAFTDISGQAGLTQLPTLAANTVLGSIAGGTPIALTTAQHTSLVNTFTSTLSGAVPAPGTVSGKVLSDNGTFITVGGTGTVTSVTAAGIVTASTNPIVGSGTLNINASVKPQGRLTLVTATPVMTTTQSAKTTIFYTPYQGNLVPIYDGTNMVPTAVAEISVATTDTTKSPAAIGASKINDWFIWDDAGTKRLGHGPDWTSDTARSAGTALVMVNGIWLNNASITNGPAASRGTYVGTTRSNGSSQLDWIIAGTAAGGTAGFYGLWNAYNRIMVSASASDSTASWTYNSTTWRSVNASNGNRVSFVRGLDEDGVDGMFNTSVQTGAGDYVAGIGLDTTSASSAQSNCYISNGSNNSAAVAYYKATPGLGFHFLQAVERQITTTAAAQPFGVISTTQMTGLHVTFRG